MGTDDLLALLPELTRDLDGVEWVVTSGSLPGDDLLITLRAAADPTRAAEVVVASGAEVYELRFYGHVSTDFAYDDADRRDALQGRLRLGTRALVGPSRIVTETIHDKVIRSTLTVDVGLASEEEETVDLFFHRLVNAMRRRPIHRETLSFAAL